MFSSSKPYTAVTVAIERLTSDNYEENDLSGIVDLIEVIRIQSTGPSEAARALRKKLKYGDAHRQLRALTILDGLIQNGGPRFQRTFADEPLLERLRILPREAVDPAVRAKCNTLFRQWSSQFKGQPGFGGLVTLYKELPKTSRMTASNSRVIQQNDRDMENENPFADSEDEPPPPPQPVAPRKASLSAVPSSSGGGAFLSHLSTSSSSTPRSSKKDRKKRKPFNLEKEKPDIMQAIAAANVAATNLLNSLKFINRETQRVSESKDVLVRFETCKRLRRQILRYIQLVESDQLIGSLLSANDELVNALMAYEIMDKSVEVDSDSETENVAAVAAAAAGGGGVSAGSPASPSGASPLQQRHARQQSRVEEDLAGLSFEEKPPPKPPRPGTHAASASGGSGIGAGPVATPLASAAAIPATTAGRRRSEPDDFDEADDDDPFGDSHEIRG